MSDVQSEPQSESEDARDVAPIEDENADDEAQPTGAAAAPASLRDELRHLRPSLWFFGAWLVLSAMSNLRYPAEEPAFWYFTPAFDVSLMFAICAVFGVFKRRMPLALHAAFVVLLVLTRSIRILDAVEQRELSRPFNVYIDVPIFPELVRLGYWTLPLWQFALAMLAVPLTLAVLAAIAHFGLRQAERYLAVPAHARFFGLLFGVLTVFSLLKPRRSELYLGRFGASAVPRLWNEVDFILNVSGYRANTLDAVTRVESELARTPKNLAKLGGQDVYLIFIESYGETVIDRPDFRAEILKTYEDVQKELDANDFAVASGLLASPAYGGGSWLAHATLSTGVRTGDQYQHDLVVAKRPKTLEHFFREAGYRTIVVQPGTTREFSGRQLNEFDDRYYAWQFGYVGPRFGWATMPDQFVLDFLRRKNFGADPRPFFLECVLVTSHAPWSMQPRVVKDWNKIENGAIYTKLAPVRYNVSWSNMVEAGPAYLRSIQYDLEVLKRFLVNYVRDGSLVIMLGDHQPIAEITHDSPDHGVPVHVVSRTKELVEPFVARGFARGMLPKHEARVRPLETFLLSFLRDYSK